MNNIIKKTSLFVLVLMFTFVLSGCNVKDLFRSTDPAIETISSKEEAVSFLSDKLVEWNNVKASVSLLSLIQTPYSGYVSIEEEKAIYSVHETDEEGNKSIKEYKYVENQKLYSYTSGSADEYKVYDASNYLSLPYTVDEIIQKIKDGTFDYEGLTYIQDSSKIILNIDVTFQGKDYSAEITYKNEDIVCTIQNLANITLSKDENNFFNDWVIDYTKFE